MLGARDAGAEIGELVEEVLGRPGFYRSVELRNRVDATPDDMFPWFEENAIEVRPLAAGARRRDGRIARAERHLARARRVPGLRALELRRGIHVGRDGGRACGGAGGVRIGRAAFPEFLGEMGRSRAVRALRQSTLDKAGHHLHLSRRKGAESTLPFLEAVFAAGGVRDGPVFELRSAIVRDLGLTAEEVGYLAGVEPDAEGVRAFFPSPDGEEPEWAEPAPETAAAPPSAPPASPASRKRVQRSLGEF